MPFEFKPHGLVPPSDRPGVLYEEVPLRDPSGAVVEGLHSVRISLDNPKQYNSYTTDMVKGVILGMRRASEDRAAVAVVFTGTGDRAFCTGGNTAEYAEYYSGRPEDFADRLEERTAAGNRALAALDAYLRDHRYLVANAMTLADIALYAYTHVAHEGGYDLDEYPAIRPWLDRIAAEPGHVPIDA